MTRTNPTAMPLQTLPAPPDWPASLGRKGADKDRLALAIIEKPKLLPEIFAGLVAEKASVRFACGGVLLALSERKPALLYPYWDRLVALLGDENTILKWGAIRTVANLASVDADHRFEAHFEQYFEPIPGPVMITAANVIHGGARIARAKPHLADRIAREVLKVQRASYQTEECRNVAIGHAVEAFDEFFDLIQEKKPVLRFVGKQLENTRNAVRKKAERFLKKHPPSRSKRS
jgi:hypothetical protein